MTSTNSVIGKGMEIHIGKVVVSVPGRWIERWQFLSDYLEDVGSVVEWTHTPASEVQAWARLNKTIDEYRPTRLHQESETVQTGPNAYTHKLVSSRQEVIPEKEMRDASVMKEAYTTYTTYTTNSDPIPAFNLSAAYQTIEFMNPYTEEYLLYVTIDNKLSAPLRSRLYDRLGNFLVSYDISSHPNLFAHSLRLLPSDPLMRLHDLKNVWGRNAPLVAQGEEPIPEPLIITQALEQASRIPHARLAGILRSSYSANTSLIPEESLAAVNWSDVRDLFWTEENAAIYNEVVESLPSESDIPTDSPPDHVAAILRSLTRIKELLRLLTDFQTEPLSLLLLAQIPLTSVSNPYPDEIGLPIDSVMTSQDGNHSSLFNYWNYQEATTYKPGIANYLIECLEFQVNNAEPEQLVYIAKFMLGLGPVFDPYGAYKTLDTTHSRPIHTLILTKMSRWLLPTRSTIPDVSTYPEVCKRIADTLGTRYLSVCANCLLLILEANLPRRWANLITSRGGILVDAYRNEKQKIEAFLEAAVSLIGDDLTPFKSWPDAKSTKAAKKGRK